MANILYSIYVFLYLSLSPDINTNILVLICFPVGEIHAQLFDKIIVRHNLKKWTFKPCVDCYKSMRAQKGHFEEDYMLC